MNKITNYFPSYFGIKRLQDFLLGSFVFLLSLFVTFFSKIIGENFSLSFEYVYWGFIIFLFVLGGYNFISTRDILFIIIGSVFLTLSGLYLITSSSKEYFLYYSLFIGIGSSISLFLSYISSGKIKFYLPLVYIAGLIIFYSIREYLFTIPDIYYGLVFILWLAAFIIFFSNNHQEREIGTTVK